MSQLHRQLPINQLPINNIVRIRKSVISITCKHEINFLNPRFHTLNKCPYFAQPLLICFAALDTSEWKDTVVDNPSDMCGIAQACVRGLMCWEGRRTREDLSDKVGCERHDFIRIVRLTSFHQNDGGEVKKLRRWPTKLAGILSWGKGPERIKFVEFIAT